MALSHAFSTFAHRAVGLPRRGCWMVLPTERAVVDVVKSIFLTLGQDYPPSRTNRVRALLERLPGGPGGPVNVDDVQVILEGLGVPAHVQERQRGRRSIALRRSIAFPSGSFCRCSGVQRFDGGGNFVTSAALASPLGASGPRLFSRLRLTGVFP